MTDPGPTGETPHMAPQRMAPMLDHAHHAALLRVLADMVASANVGAGGLVGLQLVVELAMTATGGAGAAFVEYGERGGRVVAACGEAGFLVGRPVVGLSKHGIPAGSGGPVVGETRLSEHTSDTGIQLHTGLTWMLRATALVGDVVAGSLQVYFKGEPGVVPEPGRSWARLLAACAAHIYAEGGGLPAYESGPAPLAIAVLDSDANVRSWNPAAERLTTRVAADVIGQPFPFPQPAVGQTVKHRISRGKWITIKATRLIGADTVALSMRPQSVTAERDHSRDLFLAVASHELRTPVTVIRGYADTLVEHWEALDESARREAVMVLGQRSRQLARLVDRLLTAASDAAFLLDGAPAVPFDLVDMLREVTAGLTAETRCAVSLALPTGLPKALGDRAGIATVVTELVTNACKYSPTRVQIDVTAGTDAQMVWFRVADRGVGIRQEHVEQAFERFWQLETGDQRGYSGVGLGLYLVRRIVERQHGWVSLRPREGGGTVAEVQLPLADELPGDGGARDEWPVADGPRRKC